MGIESKTNVKLKRPFEKTKSKNSFNEMEKEEIEKKVNFFYSPYNKPNINKNEEQKYMSFDTDKEMLKRDWSIISSMILAKNNRRFSKTVSQLKQMKKVHKSKFSENCSWDILQPFKREINWRKYSKVPSKKSDVKFLHKDSLTQ